MRIGTNNSLQYKRFGREEGFKKIAEIGYTDIDYCTPCDLYYSQKIFNLSDEELFGMFKQDFQYIKAAGLSVSQTHTPFPTYNENKESFEKMADAIRRTIMATSIFECNYAVVHCAMVEGWSTETDPEGTKKFNMELFERLLPTAEKYNVCIALENMPGAGVSTGTAEKLCEYIDMMHSKYMVACLDTGHANISKQPLSHCVKTLANRLKVLHVHDNDSRSDNHYPTFVGAPHDWYDFIDALEEIGYEGVFSLESSSFLRNMPTDELFLQGDKLMYDLAKHLVDRNNRK